MDTNRSNGAVFFPLIFLSSSLLLIRGYLATFTRLMADDFCSMYYAERFGLFRSIWYWRLNWSGRYSAFAIDWLISDVLGPYSVPVFITSLLAVWVFLMVIVIYLFLQQRAPQKNNKLASIMAGTLALFLVFTISPDIPQSVYWMNGMRSYAMPLIMITAGCVFYELYINHLNTRAKQFLGAVGTFLFFFINGGFSETFVVMQFFLLLFLIALTLTPPAGRKLDTALLILIAGIVGTVASLLMVITAPGNVIRQSQLPPHPDLPGLITISIQGYGNYLSAIFLSPARLMGLVGVLAAFIWLGGYYRDQFRDVNWQFPIFLIGGILLPFVCIPPGVFGYSEPPPARTVIIPFFILTIFLCYACFLAGGWLATDTSISLMTRRSALILSILFVGFSSFAQIDSLYKEKDIYVNFAKNWDVVDEQILSAKARGDKTITIPANENWAKLNTLIDNPKFWVNVCYKQYYGISVIGPSPETVQP